MKEIQTTITNLQQLLDDDVLQLVNAEYQLKNTLQDWIIKASALPLKAVLQKYASIVDRHASELTHYCKELDLTDLPQPNRLIQSLIEGITNQTGRCVDVEVRDAALLSNIQLITHCKICMYGSIAAFAQALDMSAQAAIFHELEVNEKQIDDRLSQLAAFEINPRAKAPVVLPG
jgi:ferritin-like metal-binding protein YciE